MAFITRSDCKEWMESNGYNESDYFIVKYHNDDIEEATFIDDKGKVIDINNDENDVVTDKLWADTNEFMESLVYRRFTKKGLIEKLSQHFGKKVVLANTTIPDDRSYDYMFTANILGDDDEDVDFYLDVDIYYLKMRNGNIYVTETDTNIF